MGLFDKRKKKKFYDGKVYLMRVNLENNYRTEVIQMAKDNYATLKADFDAGNIDNEMFNGYLRSINDYVKKADDRYYPIENNL